MLHLGLIGDEFKTARKHLLANLAGSIGDEFKTARKHLLANLAGSAAWKNGRPAPSVQQAPAPEQGDGGNEGREDNPC